MSANYTSISATLHKTPSPFLSDDDLRHVVPSVFAASPWEGMSARYKFIPTFDVVAMLRDKGFRPTWASQSRSRVPGKADFTKHMIRFRSDELAGELATRTEVPELVLVNSHDRSAAYRFLSGIFRMVCGNGIIAQSSDFGGVSVRHSGSGDFHQRIADATYQVMDDAPKTMAAINGWKQIELSGPQREAFAKAAHQIVPDKPIVPTQLLRARREDDRPVDLWTTSNVVQENIIKGSIRGRTPSGKRTTTRPVKSVGEDLRINRALWTLTEEMAKLV